MKYLLLISLLAACGNGNRPIRSTLPTTIVETEQPPAPPPPPPPRAPR
jgi:hypothetical protein